MNATDASEYQEVQGTWYHKHEQWPHYYHSLGQGVIFRGIMGARLTLNLQALIKCLQQFMCFWCKFDRMVFPYSCQTKEYLVSQHNKAISVGKTNFKTIFSCCNKRFFLEEISCCKTNYAAQICFYMLIFPSIEEENCPCWKYFLVTGCNILS